MAFDPSLEHIRDRLSMSLVQVQDSAPNLICAQRWKGREDARCFTAEPAEEGKLPYFTKLQEFVNDQRAHHTVYPPEEDVFNAFKATPFDKVKVLLLGQDPYHGPGQAHGLCFSVRPQVRTPPSLVNIYKELEADLGIPPARHGFPSRRTV